MRYYPTIIIILIMFFLTVSSGNAQTNNDVDSNTQLSTASDPAEQVILEEEDNLRFQKWTQPSIMYDDTRIEQLNIAIQSFEALRLYEDTLVPLEELEEIPLGAIRREVTKPGKKADIEFFLNSVAYFAPGKWTVWVNQNKITPDDNALGNLFVENVVANLVTFKWKTRLIEKIAPHWRTTLIEQSNGNYRSEQFPITINETGDEIMFTLQSNQRFVARDLEILEGKPAFEAVVADETTPTPTNQ